MISSPKHAEHDSVLIDDNTLLQTLKNYNHVGTELDDGRTTYIIIPCRQTAVRVSVCFCLVYV